MAELRATAATFSRGTSYKMTFVGLGIADLLLTLYALSAGYTEQNPVFAGLQHNPMGLFLLKIAGPARHRVAGARTAVAAVHRAPLRGPRLEPRRTTHPLTLSIS